MLYPKLYKSDSKGKLRSWRVETNEEGSYRTIAGLEDGKAAISEWTLCVAKNVGRSNETTPVQQCDIEVDALYQKKRDKHYVDTPNAVKEERAYFEVKLAKEYSKRKHKLFVPGRRVFSQPKLDGLRGPTTKEGSFSRGGNKFETVNFIAELLASVFEFMPDLVLDGELYNHDLRDDFNAIVSAIKRGTVGPEEEAVARDLAELHVYDCFIPSRPDLTFSERQTVLRAVLGTAMDLNPAIKEKVKIVETREVTNEAEIDHLYERYLNFEYEGQMLIVDEPYKKDRSDDLQKRKEDVEEEFPVVRIEAGKGNWAGAAKRVICLLPDGREFGCGLRGTREKGREILNDPIGYKTATVRFNGLTPDGVPRFGRVKQLYRDVRDD